MDKNKKEFESRIDCKPDFAFLNVRIPQGKTLRVEASAMASMDTNIVMKTKFKGGFKRFLSGESLFINEFSAESGEGEINIAPGSPGDLEHVFLENDTIYLQGSAFVASGMDIETDAKWQGFKKGFFSGQSMFLIKCSGTGDLWFNSYGGIIEIDVNGDYIVDTGFIVGFTDGLTYDVKSVGGYKSLFLSGEGLVCRFQGTGKVWIQTRQIQPLASFLYPYRPVERRNSG
ncbi:MAG: TIGR00266 family protein [Leptospiraceae bacterium]|nr:TIGR00266 family protein [Leptospiraceae bacterium]MCP5513553.1 TIGR00266 family protein [Leptospiraceae bacterium]